MNVLHRPSAERFERRVSALGTQRYADAVCGSLRFSLRDLANRSVKGLTAPHAPPKSLAQDRPQKFHLNCVPRHGQDAASPGSPAEDAAPVILDHATVHQRGREEEAGHEKGVRAGVPAAYAELIGCGVFSECWQGQRRRGST